MLTIVTWKWKPPRDDYRSKFTGEHVNILANMVDRHYKHDHRFVCVTDDPEGIDKRIETIPIWNEYGDIPPPQNQRNPSCYRRLKMFSVEAEKMFGRRFVSIDLDTVITQDLTRVWNRPEDFVMWGGTHSKTPYNGSMVLMTAGARKQVWERFHPDRSPALAKQMGYYGSDQAWISACLGPNERRWTTMDGIYSFRNHIHEWQGRLPHSARIVFFHGEYDPWTPIVQKRYPWVKENYK